MTRTVIRGEIPVLYYRSHRLPFDNDGIMWFSASTKHFVGMNRLGKLVKIINLGDQYIRTMITRWIPTAISSLWPPI